MNPLARGLMVAVAIVLSTATLTHAGEKAAASTPITELPSNSVIVFGELHGTNEIPVFFVDRVEELLDAGHTVHVGLEFSHADEKLILEAMDLPEAERSGKLLSTDHWQNGRDGRSSIAMSEMIGRLGDLRQQHGQRLAVFSYDVDYGWQGKPNERDAFMARTIGDHRARATDSEWVLVLSGNAHAFAAPGAPWNAEFRSMAVQLAAHHPVVSLRNLQSGGTAWICTPECGARTVQGAADSRAPGIYLEPLDMDWAERTVYDGVFFLGELSASPPLADAGLE